MTTSPDALETAAAAIIRIDADIATLNEARDAHLATLATAAHDGTLQVGRNPLGNTLVTVKGGARRLDARKLEATYPATEHPGLYTPKLDTKLVRAAFAPNQLAQFESVGASTIQVTPA